MSEIELHRKLLGDRARNLAFEAALRKVIKPGRSTVADLGAGTGFLSFLARRLGAKHCTLVEYTDMLGLAEQLARKNRIDGLTFVQAHSAELAKPPKVDLVISETLGNYALEENLLETVIDARRYLRKSGLIIPGRLRQYAAPVITSRLQAELDIWPDVGFDLDLAPARTISLNNMYVKTIRPGDVGGSPDTAQCWDDLDFSPAAKAPSSQRSHTLKWELDWGLTVHGYALWWECELVPGITISTSPFAPATHWDQIYLPLLQPCTLEPGDTLEVTLGSDTRPQSGIRVSWRTRQLRRGKAVVEQSQDTRRGLI